MFTILKSTEIDKFFGIQFGLFEEIFFTIYSISLFLQLKGQTKMIETAQEDIQKLCVYVLGTHFISV